MSDMGLACHGSHVGCFGVRCRVLGTMHGLPAIMFWVLVNVLESLRSYVGFL